MCSSINSTSIDAALPSRHSTQPMQHPLCLTVVRLLQDLSKEEDRTAFVEATLGKSREKKATATRTAPRKVSSKRTSLPNRFPDTPARTGPLPPDKPRVQRQDCNVATPEWDEFKDRFMDWAVSEAMAQHSDLQLPQQFALLPSWKDLLQVSSPTLVGCCAPNFAPSNITADFRTTARQMSPVSYRLNRILRQTSQATKGYLTRCTCAPLPDGPP